MATIGTNKGYFLAGPDQSIEKTVILTSPVNTPLHINLYIVLPGLNKTVKKSLPAIQSGVDYTATFDLNNALHSELLVMLEDKETFAFPADPDAPIVDRSDLMLEFYTDHSYTYMDANNELAETATTDNAAGVHHYAIQGGISRVMLGYLHSEGLAFDAWLKKDTNKWFSWMPNNLPVHPSQPVRLWFLNNDLLDTLHFKVNVYFTDGTALYDVYRAVLTKGTGLYEVACGPLELRLSTIDITKTVAKYDVWLESINTIIGETYDRFTKTNTSIASSYLFASFDVPDGAGHLKCNCKIRITNAPADLNIGNLTGAMYDGSAWYESPAVNVAVSDQWQDVFLDVYPYGTGPAYESYVLSFKDGVWDNMDAHIEIKDLVITDSNDVEIPVLSINAGSISIHESVTEELGTELQQTEKKTFLIDRNTYERNDLLFFRNSLGVHETLWCNGRRKERLNVENDETIRPLTTPSLTKGTIRSGRGETGQGFEMNTGYYPKQHRHYLMDFVAAGEAVLPVGFFLLPVVIGKGKYEFGEDGEDLFSLSFQMEVAHKERHYSQLPDVPSPWGDFNNDFNEDFFI